MCRTAYFIFKSFQMEVWKTNQDKSKIVSTYWDDELTFHRSMTSFGQNSLLLMLAMMLALGQGQVVLEKETRVVAPDQIC